MRKVDANARLASAFLDEGYKDVAKSFYQQAILTSPRGATRARQGMAKVFLAETNDSAAEQYAREAIQMGKFQAKTVCVWPTLISARVKQGKEPLDSELFTSLNLNQSGSPLARAILTIVKSLRGYGDESWKSLAKEWITKPKIVDEVIEIELAKILLSEEKLVGSDERMIALAAYRIFRSDKVSPREMVATAKDVTRMLLLAGKESRVLALGKKAGRRFGKKLHGEIMHASALGAMLARRHDVGRAILQSQIDSLNIGSKQWSQDLWALAQLEVVTKNFSEAAKHYLNFTNCEDIRADFRVKSLLLWVKYTRGTDQEIDVVDIQETIINLLDEDLDLTTLLNIGRQLSFSKKFTPILEFVVSIAEDKALTLFENSESPEEALSILIRLSRKQFWDFKTPEKIVQFWEGISDKKREYLWSEKSDYWEYLSLVFESYIEIDKPDEAQSLAALVVNNSTAPEVGLIWLGTAYANWRRNEGNRDDAIVHYNWIINEIPTHPVAAHAYYWLAVSALQKNDFLEAERNAKSIRRCFAGRPSFAWQWQLDARALIIIALSQNRIVTINEGGLYDEDYVKTQEFHLKEDIKIDE